MKTLLLVFMLILISGQPLLGGEYDCTENSISLYLSGASPVYWYYPESDPSGASLHYPMEGTFVFGGGFDLGWGLKEQIDLLVGFNQILRAPIGEALNEETGLYEKEAITLAVTPIYMNLRYKTPFQLYVGGGFNWSVIRLVDEGTPYAASGGFGLQGFVGLEMRGTSRASRSFSVFGELGYCIMSGFTNVIEGSSLAKRIQMNSGLYARVGVRKYL